MLKYKNKHYTMLEKKILRVRKSERSESAVNLKFGFESFPRTVQLISKNVLRLCSRIGTESRKNSVRYFQSFVSNPTIRFIQTFQRRSHCHCATVIYFRLLPVSDHLLPHLNVSSLPFLLLNNNHSTKDQHEFPPLSPFPIRGAFGVRSESVGSSVPRPHNNQNARSSPVPRPTETRSDRAPFQAIARKTRTQHKVKL